MFEEATLQALCETDPEIQVYFAIQVIGGFVWRMEHDMADGRIPEADHPAIDADIVIARGEQLKLVRSLTRFGLTTPIEEQGAPTKEYWAWYKKWNNYVENLSNEQFDELDKALSAHDDVSMWKPAEEE
jgi:hypothetical protein